MFRSRKQRSMPRFNIVPPRPSPDRNGVAIAAIAKNEGSYLGDWLSFHSLAGVREVILYDNASTDDTAKIAQSFPGISTTVVPWEIKAKTTGLNKLLSRQSLAYCHAICTFGHRYRWMAFIDIDEFIVPKNHRTISEALETVSGFTNISLPWAMFGHGGHFDKPEAAVPFAYLERARNQGPETGLLKFKCIVDPCTVTQVSAHRFKTVDMGNHTANMLGQTASLKDREKNSEFVTNESLQLNHYYLKSKVEMERKIAAGGISSAHPAHRESAIRRRVPLIESEAITDFSAVEFLGCHGVESTIQLREYFS